MVTENPTCPYALPGHAMILYGYGLAIYGFFDKSDLF
jgi:hypothetical protein